jgi:methionyl-tRNA formyltransferase
MTRAVVFAYSEVGYRCLQVLLQKGVSIPLVFSHADDPGETQWFGNVVELARANNLEVVTPESPETEAWLSRIESIQPDFIFAFYYRYLLSDRILQAAQRLALNMHGSLLPKYRGRAPVNWALVHGEQETGVSLHQMVRKPDAGALYGQQAVPILINDTALDVSMKVAVAAAQLLERVLPELEAGRLRPEALDLSAGSYYGRRRPEDGRIDWHQPILAVHNLIRAVAPPFPGAFCVIRDKTLQFLGSVYRDEAAGHPMYAPCVYVEKDQFYADGIDGKRIAVTGLALNDEPLSAQRFAALFGDAPLAFR